ncbi:MAG: glycosyltransferase family 2 protein [Bacteroidota bacterium]|jgi:glycosyltransferase involved in cell wall biosynthesis|uniref:glycosyltransferase family 2 protein n=1 Tax=Flavobacterium sp. 11 TaxID=357523 RepID=UPI000C179445|nr:glycosyltransferase family 2 protein [Flavobacterium sp. 11]PIF60586.1 dolichol-phosphate mannosyltransferase [Flavobacterium sp. 11]
MKLSFVIPVFRNAGSIVPTYEKLMTLLLQLQYDHEFIFVNDGSDDSSMEELLPLHHKDFRVKVISFSRNFGQVPAIIAGLKVVSGEAVVIMSADLQEPIELIEEMIAKWKAGNEIVIGHRVDREDSFIANKASVVFYRLMRYVNPKMPKGGFDFMLIGQKALQVLNQIDERNRFFQGDILWLGFSTAFIPYSRMKRPFGKSQWTLSKKLKYFIDGLLNTSYAPIRVMSLLGISFSFIGFIYAIVIAYNRFINNTPFDGWAPIMILILIIGGLIMLMLGIIGEYVWRTYDETRKRPLYIIKDEFIRDETNI